jgi:hypothetical protein
MGLCLLFLPNVPGTMFIQGATSIPDSRVPNLGPIVIYLKRELYSEKLISGFDNKHHESNFVPIIIRGLQNIQKNAVLAYFFFPLNDFICGK